MNMFAVGRCSRPANYFSRAKEKHVSRGFRGRRPFHLAARAATMSITRGIALCADQSRRSVESRHAVGATCGRDARGRKVQSVLLYEGDDVVAMPSDATPLLTTTRHKLPGTYFARRLILGRWARQKLRLILKMSGFYPILNFGLFWAALLMMSVLYPTRNVRQFWADPTFSVVRSTFLAEEEAQNVEILLHPIFLPLLGRPLKDVRF